MDRHKASSTATLWSAENSTLMNNHEHVMNSQKKTMMYIFPFFSLCPTSFQTADAILVCMKSQFTSLHTAHSKALPLEPDLHIDQMRISVQISSALTTMDTNACVLA